MNTGVAGLMAQAHAIQREAAQRYLEFADMLGTHNNREVAELFRAIAARSERKAREIAERIGADAIAAQPWPVLAPPDYESAHYLMQPWHVLRLAIDAQRRALDFFASLAQAGGDSQAGRAARQLQAEQAEDLAQLEAWLERVPQPAADWDDDPDPPCYRD